MKRTVVLPQPDINVISIHEIDINKFIGVVNKKNKQKSVLIFNGIDFYKSFTLNANGDFFVALTSNSIQGVINTALGHGSTVYQFDTIQELGKWLAEE